MSVQSDSLSAFSLKFSKTDHDEIKINSIQDPNIQYLYELCDEAIKWALENKNTLLPIASPARGSYKTYYISKDMDQKLKELKDFWDVKPPRALYSALKHYCNYKKTEVAA